MQKINYFLWVVLFSLVTHAQISPIGENISLDQQLTNISQSSVTSGIIYERVIPVANLYNFNKVSTFNTANFPYFKQALSEMRRASNNTKFISLDAFKTMVAANTSQNEVDVAILNTQFHVLNFNEDNPSAGGMTYNTTTNKFDDISGKVPFYMLHNTVIAPAKEHVSGTSVMYKLRNDLYFKNGTKTIKTLVANFGDGINRTLINNSVLTNQDITVNYNTSGEKISTFTITYSDNTTMVTYGKIYFNYKPITYGLANSSNSISGSCYATDPLKQDFQLQADIPFTGYNAGDPTIKAKIDYRIFYAFAHTDKKVRKPIIIIDGFDPGDKRKIEDCDCENIPNCASRNTTNGVFDAQKHRAMKDLMMYVDNGLTQDLLNKLRSEGYDVIMVNHPTYETTNLQNGQTVTIDGGAYYIESNAMALIKLLQQTKSLLVSNGSTNDIAIVAPSMAGQISRYALSYMEKKFAETNNNIWKHNTYLWISVDSPHLGANIPMGDQALLYLLKEGGIDQAADFYDKELSSPAAQQQLIEFHRAGNNYHIVNQNMLNAQTTSQNMPSNRGNSLFQQHYNNQNSNGIANSNGWPQNLRKIALVNGSLTGSKQTQLINGSPFIPFANDGEKVFNLRGFQRIHIPLLIGSITFRIHIASLESNNMPSFGTEARIARFKKLFNDKTTKATNINPRGCMDNVPGGFFDAQADISEATTSQDPVPGVTLSALNNWSLNNFSIENIFKSVSEILGGSEWYRHEYNPIHSFIPSFSALGHLQPNQNWANPLNINLKCTSNNLTPFDSYFGLDKNTQHTSFTKESVTWLLKELQGIPQAPSFPIQEGLLTGPDLICNTNTVYSFSDICKLPSTVTTWSVSPNLQIVSSTSYSVTVSQISNGQGTITATFQNGQTVTKTIWVGKPSFFLEDYYFEPQPIKSTVCAVSDNPNVTFEQQGITNIVFKLCNSNTILNSNNSTCIMPRNNCCFEVTVTNICGSTTVQHECFLNKQSATTTFYTIYPNPSKDIVNIELRNANNIPEKGATISGELFDMMGQSKSKVEIIDNKATFSVHGLNKGIYILKIYINNQVESHQIAVE